MKTTAKSTIIKLLYSCKKCYTQSYLYFRKSDVIITRQNETPLFTALKEYAANNPLQFHIPGHKKGVGIDPDFRAYIGDNALAIDLINIAPLDDLHSPHGIIKDAEELAAAAFNADYTFFSVQGTSTAIMAMIMAVCYPGDKILVPRNVHKSILSGIIFAGANPIFIHPEMDEKLGIAHGITPHSVKRALEKHPDTKAILVINPTYYGIAANLQAIVDVAHSYQIPVLVDEAHGAHINFNSRLPLSAMEAGADMAATSLHKLGGSMTQSSILNMRGSLVDPKRVQAVMSMLTTTSTSYLLLASIDVARRNLATKGEQLLDTAINLSNHLRSHINLIPGLYCPGREILGTEATFDLDDTKILINVIELGITGYQAEQWLRDNYRIEVELSDLYNLLCIISLGDSEQSIEKLLTALQELSKAHNTNGKLNHIVVKLPEIPAIALSPRDAFYSETDKVPFRESSGHVIAEFITIYPPGIPVLLPGEVITQENIDYILKNKAAGLPVQGSEDIELKTVKVIKERKAISLY